MGSLDARTVLEQYEGLGFENSPDDFQRAMLRVLERNGMNGTPKKKLFLGESSGSDDGDEDMSDEEDEDEIAESSHHGRSQAQIEHKKAFKSVKVAKALKKTSKSEKRAKTFPGGGRKGVSSGLSTVVHQGRRVKKGGSYGGPGGGQWWRELGN